MEFIFKHFKKFWLIATVADILLVSGIAWVVIHFIRKFW
jgi:hypothetical protein